MSEYTLVSTVDEAGWLDSAVIVDEKGVKYVLTVETAQEPGPFPRPEFLPEGVELEVDQRGMPFNPRRCRAARKELS